MTVARATLAMILGILLPLVVELLDRRWLTPEARERAWNVATWGSALYAFGPLSLLGWYWVTRRGWRRLLGVPVALLVVVAIQLVDELASLLL